jgi:peptidoglycan/xylan/chitin deacetylase (PgdA/CDA1 family)
VVYPILAYLGIPATFFVCPALIDSSRWLWNHEARERLDSLSDIERTRLEHRVRVNAGPDTDIIEWMKTLPVSTRRVVEDQIRELSPHFGPTEQQRQKFDMMSWAMVQDLDPELIEVGSHTATHPILSKLTEVELDEEIVRSHTVLEGKLNRPVECFCYPNGDYDSRALAQVRATYNIAVTTRPGPVPIDVDPHRLPRIAGTFELPLLLWRMHRPDA